MMHTFRLSLVTMAVLGTFVSATSAAVTHQNASRPNRMIPSDDIFIARSVKHVNDSDGDGDVVVVASF